MLFLVPDPCFGDLELFYLSTDRFLRRLEPVLLLCDPVLKPSWDIFELYLHSYEPGLDYTFYSALFMSTNESSI